MISEHLQMTILKRRDNHEKGLTESGRDELCALCE